MREQFKCLDYHNNSPHQRTWRLCLMSPMEISLFRVPSVPSLTARRRRAISSCYQRKVEVDWWRTIKWTKYTMQILSMCFCLPIPLRQCKLGWLGASNAANLIRMDSNKCTDSQKISTKMGSPISLRLQVFISFYHKLNGFTQLAQDITNIEK